MNVSKPIFTIGIKCKVPNQNEKVRVHIAMEIILNMLIGESSTLYKELYQTGNIFSMPSLSYEFGDNYAHILIAENANDPDTLFDRLREEIESFKKNGLNEEDFERTRKMIYGEYIKQYNDVTAIARMFLSDFMKGINSFDYLEEVNIIDLNFVNQVLKENFDLDKMVLSVVK